MIGMEAGVEFVVTVKEVLPDNVYSSVILLQYLLAILLNLLLIL